jgi:hypothetical protein
MKKNKSTKRIRFFILLFTFITCIYSNRASASITGATSMVPGVSSNYGWCCVSGGINPTWSANNSNVTFTGSGYNVTVNVSKNINVCSFVITVTYDYVGTSGTITGLTETKTVYVDPFLKGSGNAYPGESMTITNYDYCAGGAGHTFCYWNWSCSDVSAIFCGGSCTGSILNTANINCPSTLPSGIISGGVYNITCNKYCGGGAYQYQSLLTVNVALRDPTISGPSGVGCGGTATTGMVFTASAVTGAAYYVWTVPSGWSITSGANTNAITVSSNGSNAGSVTVRAYAASGSPVKSNIVTQNVVCCTTNLTVSGNVSAGNTDSQQADNSITATNTINNTANARYHAGSTIYLEPGFYAAQGSYFHGYIEGCTGNYYRTANSNDTTATETGNETHTAQLENSDFAAGNELRQEELNVFPNPNKGEFKLVFDRNSELPVSIKVKDIFGKEIESIQNPEKYEYNFNMNEFSSGIYFINVSYNNKTVSKKLIKN